MRRHEAGNNDGKITEADRVYKQLRLWFDLDGNGSAGDLEVLDLKMNYVGADMAALGGWMRGASTRPLGRHGGQS